MPVETADALAASKRATGNQASGPPRRFGGQNAGQRLVLDELVRRHHDHNERTRASPGCLRTTGSPAASDLSRAQLRDRRLVTSPLGPDDKSLPKDERKSLQIEHAPHKSAWANGVACGLRDGSLALEAPALLAEFDALFARFEELKAGSTLHPLALAVKIAAHATHKPDKGGAPYILHPLRMMLRMNNDEARMTAVLHDVVEDHADEGWTFERLGKAGIPESVIEAVHCVTKLTDDEDYVAFIERAATNPIAKAVTIADLEDIMNLLRLDELLDKDVERLHKYHVSWKRLS